MSRGCSCWEPACASSSRSFGAIPRDAVRCWAARWMGRRLPRCCWCWLEGWYCASGKRRIKGRGFPSFRQKDGERMGRPRLKAHKRKTRPQMTELRTIEVPIEATGQRLDQFLAAQLEGVSRSRVQMLMDQGDVLINDETPKPSLKLRGGEIGRA